MLKILDNSLIAYWVAYIAPVVSWASFNFLYYAGFSGKSKFYNSLPVYAIAIWIWSLPFIAILGLFVCRQICKKNGYNVKTIASVTLPFILGATLVLLYLLEIVMMIFH